MASEGIKRGYRNDTVVLTDGLYELRVILFGLSSRPGTLQRMMAVVLAGLKWNICLIYIDDVIIFATTFEDQMKRLQNVFN